MPVIGAPSPRLDLGEDVGIGEVGGRLDDRLGTRRRVLGLEDARSDENRLGTELHRESGIGRCGQATGAEQRHLELAGLGDLLHERQRCLQLLGPLEQLGLVGLGDLAHVADDVSQVADGLDDVAGSGLALGPDHRSALGDATQGLTEIGGSAHERHVEAELVDVMGLVGRGEHLGLVDEVDAERLQDLGFDEVTDADLGHHGDRHRCLDAFDHLGVAHAGDATVAADVGRHPLERHHRDCSGVLGDLRLLRRDDVHDDATLHHLGESALDGEGSGATSHGVSVLSSPGELLRWNRAVRQGAGGVAGNTWTTPSATSSMSANSIQVLPGLSAIGSPSASRYSIGKNTLSRLQVPSTNSPSLNT